ncbi:CTP pyrophosphohydrolase [Rhodocyclaceae bacterium]|nr:CTP pyrophosphohydrolase [Rhodocyclaceae bacterium]
MNDSIREPDKIVEVAAAVLQKPDGSFLLAQRPPDKIWAGYWEFPGGKVEPGETPHHALVRELREELGIEVETAYPWVTRVFTYPHATVRLNFFRVTAWSGEMHPHEGQEFAWQRLPHVDPLQENSVSSFPRRREPSLIKPLDSRLRGNDGITVSPVLPANAPILRALELPALYAISNVKELGEEAFMQRLEAALRNGLRLVQLREKNYSREALRELALKMLPLMKQYGARLLINADIELAREIGADGVHLNGGQLAELHERPAVEWCAASCHNATELRRAEELGCDFAVLSPVLPTLSHPGEPALGWEKFSRIAMGCSIPVYALGGLQLADRETAWQHGAHGIALLRQAW